MLKARAYRDRLENPATHSGDFSIYAIADQMVWRSNVSTPQSLDVQAMAMGLQAIAT
jgi:hypothetical protein